MIFYQKLGNTSKINLPEFWDFSQVRSKHKNVITILWKITVSVKHQIISNF